MSGFYGNRFMEFKKFFFRFFLKNSGKDVSTFDDSFKDNLVDDENEISLEPESTYDELVLDTANKWIRMKKYQSEGRTNGVSFFHAPSEVGENINISNEVSKSEEEATALTYDDRIVLTNLSFDAAGHISKCEEKVYKIPNISNAILRQDQLDDLFRILKKGIAAEEEE